MLCYRRMRHINIVGARAKLLSTHLISLNFSSASGDGFLSGWNCSTDSEFLKFLFVAENFSKHLHRRLAVRLLELRVIDVS